MFVPCFMKIFLIVLKLQCGQDFHLKNFEGANSFLYEWSPIETGGKTENGKTTCPESVSFLLNP